MKYIYMIFVMAMMQLTIALAQNSNQATYFPNPADKVFEGTWVYTKGQETFKVVLKFNKKVLDKANLSSNFIEGNFYYIKDGNIIDSKTIKGNGSAIVYGFASEESPNIVKASIIDATKDKTGSLVLTLLPGNAKKMRWQVSNREQVMVNGKKGDASFSFPTNIILSKQE